MSVHQFGFQKGLSTSDALAEFSDIVYNSINKNNTLIAVYLDFSRAFDTVNIDIMLKKLEHYGVRGPVNCWFASYLRDRNYYVNIGDAESSLYRLNIGVPQGSCLGPLLFNLYINDLYVSCPNLNLVHYADDTTAFISGSDPYILVNSLNVDLQSIHKWLQCNRLTLNVKKSAYMIFGNNNFVPNLKIGNETVSKVDEAKFLGIIIDSKLTFKHHFENVLKKLSSVSGIIFRNRDYIPRKVLRMLYLSLGWSYLTYGIVVWGKSSITFGNKIQAMQNRIMRSIFGSSDKQIYKTNYLLNFEQSYMYFAVIKLYKEINTNITPYFSNRIASFQSNHQHNTRFTVNNNLVPPLFNRSKCQSSFIYQSIKVWNNLPPEIKSSDNVELFTRKLKNHLISN